MFSLLNRRRKNELSKKCKIRHRKCILEPLELRTLLSAAGLPEITMSPLAQAVTNVSAPYTPAEIRQSYGFSSLTANGAGQTIAIVDAYDDPNILSDLKAFDAKYGLPDPSFQKVSQTGSQTKLPSANASWGLEISLDVEWAHAVAPAAKILLVEASSNSLSNLLTAVDYASSVAKVVSMSWGSSEFSSETSYDSHFSPQLHPGVTFIASSGDTGGMAIWPAVSPYVLSVGGSSLTIVSSAAGVYSYSSESSWSGSGGGYSSFEKEPSWQYAVQSTGRRSTPDVAYDANPSTGFAVYDTYAYRGWYTIGGTSAPRTAMGRNHRHRQPGQGRKRSLIPVERQFQYLRALFPTAFHRFSRHHQRHGRTQPRRLRLRPGYRPGIAAGTEYRLGIRRRFGIGGEKSGHTLRQLICFSEGLIGISLTSCGICICPKSTGKIARLFECNSTNPRPRRFAYRVAFHPHLR